MKTILLVITVLLTTISIAQTDSTKNDTYDIIHLRNGESLRGQIITFDPSDGDISFVDQNGRKYFLTTKDYMSYEENIALKPRKKDKPFVLKPRKETGYELSLGFSAVNYNVQADLLNTETYYLNNHLSHGNGAGSISVGFGRYLNRQNYIGLYGDISVLTSAKNVLDFGFKYAYQYDGYKKNVSWYIPITIGYSYLRSDGFTYEHEDSTAYTFDNETHYSYYHSYPQADQSIGSLSLSLGQGISFMLENKKSISIELSVLKLFPMSVKFYDITPLPKVDYNLSGIKLGFKYNI